MNSTILIGKWGKIISGENAGWYVLVEDDSKGSTGGFYVLTSPEPPPSKKGFDDWVENIDKLNRYFHETNWQIQWMDSDGNFSE